MFGILLLDGVSCGDGIKSRWLGTSDQSSLFSCTTTLQRSERVLSQVLATGAISAPSIAQVHLYHWTTAETTKKIAR